MLGGDRERRALMVFGVALVALVAATVVYMKPRLPALFQAPPPPLSRVCDVSFVDGRHGSLVLCAAADATHESVFTTADAGRTWRRVRVGDISEARVDWFDGAHAVLEGYVTRGVAGWTTDDGGLLHIRGSDDEVLYVLDGIPIVDRIDPRFATALNLEMIRSMEVITGNIPAEYGNRLGAVVAIQPKSGIDTPLFGAVRAGAGSFHSGEVALESGGRITSRLGFFLAAAANRSRRWLDPPDAGNFGNRGGSGQSNLRLDWHPDRRDTLIAHVWNGGTRFRVPNTSEQEAAGTAERADLRNESQSVTWQRAWSSTTVTDLALYRRAFASRLLPGADDTPFIVAQDRRHGRQGLIASVSRERRGHSLKAGFEGMRVTPRERFSYAVTDDAAAEELGFTAAARSFVPGRPFEFDDHKTFGQVSWHIQDTFAPAKRLTLSLGLRYDYSRQLVRAQGFSPRLGAVFYVAPLRGALRASYNRLFQPPPVENLLVSASEAARRLSPLSAEGGGYTPLVPGRVSAYEVGYAHDVRGLFRIDVDCYWRRFRNFGDPNLFFATTIIFPNTVARGSVRGLDARIDLPERRGFSAYLSYNNQNLYQVGPVNGGLFLTAELTRFGPGVRFVPDQDQRNSGAFGVAYHHRPSGLWVAFAGRHESGAPLEIDPDDRERVVRRLTQQGLVPDAVLDLERGRVRPRTLFDVSVGIELFSKERVALGAQLDVENLTDRIFVYNFGNPFAGTHFGHPRLVSSRLKLTFR